ncbi:MAG TPA: hypothetical protein VKA47_13930 [Solirubrobacterales bacterium]|nr:hypothetical protein [Solirubrobacterales bacterium]
MRNRSHRIWLCMSLAAVVAALAVPVAMAAPVDPPTAGQSTSQFDPPPQEPQVSSVNAIVPPQSSQATTLETASVSSGGFDWGDAGIGAGAMFALTMIGIGGTLVLSSRRHREARQRATA